MIRIANLKAPLDMEADVPLTLALKKLKAERALWLLEDVLRMCLGEILHWFQFSLGVTRKPKHSEFADFTNSIDWKLKPRCSDTTKKEKHIIIITLL